MIESAPKPGPHLSTLPSVILSDPDPVRASFRELAKTHARAASELALGADEAQATNQPWENLADLAQVHALASLACSAVAPVARQRLTPCKAVTK